MNFFYILHILIFRLFEKEKYIIYYNYIPKYHESIFQKKYNLKE